MRAAFAGYLGKTMKKKAPQWAAETPNIKKLPKHVGNPVKAPGYDQNGQLLPGYSVDPNGDLNYDPKKDTSKKIKYIPNAPSKKPSTSIAKLAEAKARA